MKCGSIGNQKLGVCTKYCSATLDSSLANIDILLQVPTCSSTEFEWEMSNSLSRYATRSHPSPYSWVIRLVAASPRAPPGKFTIVMCTLRESRNSAGTKFQ